MRKTLFAMLAAVAVVVTGGMAVGLRSAIAAPNPEAQAQGARAQSPQQRSRPRTRPPGFGKRVDTIRKDYKGPSVVAGKQPGVKAGSYPPDFQLEPVKLSSPLQQWLGEKAPKRFEDKVMLSDLIGHQPVMLLLGSYT